MTKKPVLLVAGGGVNDGRSLAAAIMLGAGAVWVGTRFVASREAGCPEKAKRGYGKKPIPSLCFADVAEQCREFRF